MFNNSSSDDCIISQLRVVVKGKNEIFCFLLKFVVVDCNGGL